MNFGWILGEMKGNERKWKQNWLNEFWVNFGWNERKWKEIKAGLVDLAEFWVNCGWCERKWNGWHSWHSWHSWSIVSTVSTVSTVHPRRNGPPLRSQCDGWWLTSLPTHKAYGKKRIKFGIKPKPALSISINLAIFSIAHHIQQQTWAPKACQSPKSVCLDRRTKSWTYSVSKVISIHWYNSDSWITINNKRPYCVTARLQKFYVFQLSGSSTWIIWVTCQDYFQAAPSWQNKPIGASCQIPRPKVEKLLPQLLTNKVLQKG